MARPIKETPVLKGKDGDLKPFKDALGTVERQS